MSTVDPKEVSATAYLISAAAGRLQAPRRWDEQGIYAVVRRLICESGRAPLDVAAAATRAITDTAANTPAALSWSKYYDSPSASAPQAEAEVLVRDRQMREACIDLRTGAVRKWGERI